MKKFASILLSMLMATGAIAAASAETYTGTAQGIGEVSVTLTVEDGKITAAEVDHSHTGFSYSVRDPQRLFVFSPRLLSSSSG